MFMRELVERYDCRVGPHRLGSAISEEQDLEKFLFDPKRKLPVLMVSRDATGDLPYGGIEQLSEQLLGMAQVVEAPPEGRYTKEWGHQSDVLDGGAARIIWPDAKPRFMRYGEGGFYRPGRLDFISEVLNDLENNASPESFDREFVAVNVTCMRFRNEQLRSIAQVDESSELKRLQRELRKRERELNWFRRELSYEQDKRTQAESRLDAAQREMERLNQELERVFKIDGAERAQETVRDLWNEKDALEDKLARRDATIRELFSEIQRYKQKDRTTHNEQNGFDSLIGDPTQNPGQLSLVGHGLNIMRDPVRKYIAERLSNGITHNYGLDDTSTALDGLGVDARRAINPESALDFTRSNGVARFDLVVSRYSRCFEPDPYELSSKLEQIRTDRNRTIHPDFEEKTAAQRSEALLNDISVVLTIIGASEESQRVEELKSAL